MVEKLSGEMELGCEFVDDKGRKFMNIDHHIPISFMKKKVSSTNLACEYVKKFGVMNEEEYEVVAHHADVDSFLSTLVLRGVIPPDKGIEDAAIAADHTGKNNAIADFLQASQETNVEGKNYKKTFEYLRKEFAKLLNVVDLDELYEMDSDELLENIENVKTVELDDKIDQRMIDNLKIRIGKRKKVIELVKNINNPEAENKFREAKEGSGVYYVEVESEIDGELAPAVFEDMYIDAKIIIISYPYTVRNEVGEKITHKGRYTTKVRLGMGGMDDSLDLHALNLNSFCHAIDKDGNEKVNENGYGGRWNAGSDKRNGGTYLEGKEFAENVEKLLRTKDRLDKFKNSLIENKGIEDKNKEEIKKALNLMVELHLSQKDRPDGPYILHPMSVAERLMNEFGVVDKNIIIAGLMHDAVEDQSEKLALKNNDSDLDNVRDKALEYLKNNFGGDVEYLVEELSNPEVRDETLWYILAEKGEIDLRNNEQSEQEFVELKNKEYARHVKKIIESDPRLFLIKLADFSFNGLSLENVTDKERLEELTKKYKPVGKFFKNILEDPAKEFKELVDKIPEEKKDWLKSKLEQLIKSKNI